MKAVTQKIAVDRRMFAAFVRAARTGHPDLDTESLRAFILNGEYDIGASGDYFLGAALQHAHASR